MLANKKRKRLTVPLFAIRGLAYAVRAVQHSYRVQVHDDAGILGEPGLRPFIAALWHNRLLLLVDFFPRHMRYHSAALASASRDGTYAASFLEVFGLEAVRGSSSRGGYHALVELRKKLQDEKKNVALTLDGPRGPRYEVQPGAVLLAEWTGLPIVPLSFTARRRWEFKGWDRTQLPKLFSHVDVVVGKPLFIPPNLNDVQRRAEIARVRDAMLAITDDTRV